jgi:hypothetical protein
MKCLENPPLAAVFQKRSKTLYIEDPAPRKTFIMIAMGPLNEENGVCGTGMPINYPDLQSGRAFIVSGDVTQYYSRESVGGGVVIILKLKYRYQDPEGSAKNLEESAENLEGSAENSEGSVKR